MAEFSPRVDPPLPGGDGTRLVVSRRRPGAHLRGPVVARLVALAVAVVVPLVGLNAVADTEFTPPPPAEAAP